MTKKPIITISLVLSLNLAVDAQDTLNTIERAMKGEMERSMTQLRSDKYSDPFFIRYRINDQQNIVASGSLGGLQNSGENSIRTKDIRVMVGDYEFNDESLDGEATGLGASYAFGYSDFTMPLGDDYLGIRRSLWITTDAIYKAAGQIYKSHLKKLEKDGKTYKEIDHKRFAKVPRVEYLEPIQEQPFAKKELEEFVREASRIFYDYENLLVSNVRASSIVNTEYFLNSEGTRYRTSEVSGNITFSVSMIDSNGNIRYKSHNYEMIQGDPLPSIKKAREIVIEMMDRLLKEDDSSLFQDNYYGPVLFTGNTVFKLFSTYLIGELTASAELSYESDYYGGGYNNNSYSLSDRIGQRVISKKLSVALHPTMTEWEGVALRGSYQIDSEGVMPPDTLVLIENGTLKDLMTTRTLTKDDQKANGTGYNPGVVTITTSETTNEEDLRQQLIDLAKEYDQQYAIIVKDSEEYGGLYNLDVYKVNVETGEEELFTGANISNLGINNLKRILGVSSKLTLNNFVGTSYIAPNALLLEDVEVSKSYNQQIKMKKPLVKNPLTVNK